MALCIWLDSENKLMPSSGKRCGQKSDNKSAASAWLRKKLIIRLFCTLFYSFPRSGVQTHLCVDVCESVRKRDRVRERERERALPTEQMCQTTALMFWIEVDVWENTNTQTRDTICLLLMCGCLRVTLCAMGYICCERCCNGRLERSFLM